MARRFHVVLAASLVFAAAAIRTRSRQGVQLQTWSRELDGEGAGARDTPVTRVVKLLEEMQKQMQKDLEEDEDLYKKLSCWCNDGEYEKNGAVSEAEGKIEELASSIEQLSARSAELKIEIKKTEAEVAESKEALAAATAIRDKELQASHGEELDTIQALENLKAAITVLAKHHDTALPQLDISLLAIGSEDEAYSSHSARSLDEFMSTNDFSMDGAAASTVPVEMAALPERAHASWSPSDLVTVRKALSDAASFSQMRHGTSYYPSYESSSGEIVGILKQMREEMGGDLVETQKAEREAAKAFGELRAAKTSFIETGEARAEKKEDELANTDMNLAEAKEDIKQTKTALAADQKFLVNLKKTCEEADSNFALRKKSRLAEMTAVSETIQILTGDEARDAMSSTFKEGGESFVQLGSRSRSASRQKAAALLRRAAARSGSTALNALATSVELDAFTKVKAAIDDMVKNLKIQQEDEVKKHDWCKTEIQDTEMEAMKTEDQKTNIESAIADLDAKLKTLADEISKAKEEVAELQRGLQSASVDRKKENIDFQKTIEDQTLTIEVLHKALDRLATFYDKEALLQSAGGQRQTPPVPQAEFKKSAGAGGVMSMIEKLIYEAKDLMKDARRSEGDAQAAYESLVEDTNASVAALMKEIMGKKKAAGRAKKDLHAKNADLETTVGELERLHKYDADMHAECDYLLKNFDARQQARSEETESLQQAKQILSGADLA